MTVCSPKLTAKRPRAALATAAYQRGDLPAEIRFPHEGQNFIAPFSNPPHLPHAVIAFSMDLSSLKSLNMFNHLS
jgi:hypothetical protein